MTFQAFRKEVRDYYKKHGRHFPWREIVDPYHVLVSEVMLQQTQADRVVPKYRAFIKTFPTSQALARVSLRDALVAWQGLGYNRRAKLLKQCAEIVVKEHGGAVPKDRKALEQLPGVGPYTAGAVRTFAFNEPDVFIETNIRAVFVHFFFPRKNKVDDREILPLIEKTLDRRHPREWYSALMDYGAMLKTTRGNPSRRSAHYTRQSAFKGSDRHLRGRILKALLAHGVLTALQLRKHLKADLTPAQCIRIPAQLQNLARDGLIAKQQNYWTPSV